MNNTTKNYIMLSTIMQVVLIVLVTAWGVILYNNSGDNYVYNVQGEATESSPVVQEEGEVQEDPQVLYSQEEVALVAKTVYGEARGCSEAEKRLVAWCILNRVDDGTWGDTVEDVVTYPGAFYGYKEDNPMDESCVEVAQDVLAEWRSGKEADVLKPYATTSEYLYFGGDGQHNWFREEY